MNRNLIKEKFPKAHLWLLVPFIITISGFYFTYWSKFSEVPFRQHAHGLTATAWYVLLVLQPWLYNKKKLSYHRKFGFIGLFLAGGLVFSALQIVPYNILSDKLSNNLKYGITFHNLLALFGFSFAVVLAMMNSRNLSKHARWMISTAFWALQPAVTRLLYIPLVRANNGISPIEYLNIWYICLGISLIPLLIIMFLDYKKEGKVYSSYLFTLIGISIATGLVKVMGSVLWWINWCDSFLIKGLQ
jgi:hypothetical protein